MSTLPDDQMGSGTGLYNLTRNMGASFGVSMVTTMLIRGGQRHQDVLATHMTPYDLPFRNLLSQLKQFLSLHVGLGTAGQRAYAITYGILQHQAMLLSYVDDFRLLAVLTLCCLPFLLLFRKGLSRKHNTRAH